MTEVSASGCKGFNVRPIHVLNSRHASRKDQSNVLFSSILHFNISTSISHNSTRTSHGVTGLILHGGNEGDCLRVPWSLPWCP